MFVQAQVILESFQHGLPRVVSSGSLVPCNKRRVRRACYDYPWMRQKSSFVLVIIDRLQGPDPNPTRALHGGSAKVSDKLNSK